MSTQNPYEAPATPLMRESENPEHEVKIARSIGGWLIIVGIAVTISPLRLLYSVLPMYSGIFSDGTWAKMTSQGSRFYNPLWERFLVGEMVGNAISFCMALTVFYLFFSKKRGFPKWYIACALFNFVFVLADGLLATGLFKHAVQLDAATIGQLTGPAIALTIWAPYMLMSQRVKETFIK